MELDYSKTPLPGRGEAAFYRGECVIIDDIDECSASWHSPDAPGIKRITTRQDFAFQFLSDTRNFPDAVGQDIGPSEVEDSGLEL